MRVNLYAAIAHIVKRLFAVITVFFALGLLWGTANATLINFDELEYTIVEDGDGDMFYEHPVTDEYLSQGLRITNGYLIHDESLNPYVSSPPNGILGSEGLTFDFIGELPTFVSMRVNGAGDYGLVLHAILFDVYGPSGLLFQTKSSGDAGSPDDSNAIPNELITFSSPTGISSISMTNYYDRRLIGTVDDLTFEYAEVPEPSGLILFGMGLFVFAFRQSRARKTR